MSRSSLTRGTVPVFALCLFLVPLLAADDLAAPPAGPESASADDTAVPAATGTAARVVYLDPATGRVHKQRPGKRGMAQRPVESIEIPVELMRSLTSSHKDVQSMTRPDGTMVAWRPGGFRTALVASIGPDGRLSMTHMANEVTEDPDEDPYGVCEVGDE